MLKKSINGLTPTKFRNLLIGGIIAGILLSGVGFWYFRSQLVSYAEQVKTDAVAASVSSNDISRLQQLQRQLKEDEVAVTRAKNIVADSKFYKYQDQIYKDVTAYANSSGVEISSVTFDSDTTASNGSVPTPAPAAGAVPPVAVPAGLKSSTATISLKSPVKYDAFMKFIHSIELNLTKMQISGISMTKLQADTIAVNPIALEVYTR